MSRLTGTGPGGRIVRVDVETAPAGRAAPRRRNPSQTIRPVAGPDDQRIPLTGMRNIIAERLLASKTQIPHFYLQIEVDAAPLMAFRAHINEQSEKTGGNKYTVNDFILKAVVRAAAAVPAVNASFDGDAIVQFKNVNLSVAIAVPDGLVTPVIKAAETKTLLEISQAVKDLATRAKNKKLSPDEFAGGTITVTNLGAYGIDQFSAIINPPQAAILSVGCIRNIPVVDDKGADRRRPAHVDRPQRRSPRRRRRRRRHLPRRDAQAAREPGADAGLNRNPKPREEISELPKRARQEMTVPKPARRPLFALPALVLLTFALPGCETPPQGHRARQFRLERMGQPPRPARFQHRDRRCRPRREGFRRNDRVAPA